MRHRGLAVIEQLFLIAIIAILAAILFPVYAQMRERAQAESCVSNMRQLLAGLQMYVRDWDETLVPATNYAVPETSPERLWLTGLAPYLPRIDSLTCPGAAVHGYAADWAGRGLISMGYSALTGFDPDGSEAPAAPTTRAMLAEPARTVLFADTPPGPTEAKYEGYVFDPNNGPDNARDPRLGTPLVADRDLVAGSSLSAGQLKPVFARHFAIGDDSGLATLGFADGHVRAYSARSIQAQERGANLIWRFR